MNEFKVIKNKLTDTATILLYDAIGIDEFGKGISGSHVAQIIFDLESAGFKKINLRINSPGGSVFDGYSIFSAILNSKIKIDTYNDGLAASIAGVILMAGRKIYMQDYALLMLHNPFINSNPTSKEIEILQLIKDSLITIFTNRTGISEDELSGIMDEETWYTASKAADKGFVDEVIKTSKKLEVSNFQIEPIYNQTKKIINQKIMMDNILNKLNLSNEATEEQAIEAIENLQNVEAELEKEKSEKEILVAELKKLQDEICELHAEKEAIVEREIEEVIENAVKENKIKADAKDSWKKLAKADFEAVKNSLNSLVAVKEAVKVMDLIKKPTNSITDEKAKWTFSEWRKNDPAGLADIKNNTPEIYEELFNKEFRK